jgi:hypothetical protein
MTQAARRGLFWSLLAIILTAVLPVALAFAASAIASMNGCTLSGAGPEPCLIGGADFGEALSILFTMHWFALLTLPAGVLALVAWVLAALILWWRGRRPT